ncbi:Uncharacterised protein [Achromobacter sp. 2789STDY5608633]|jgi:hypothetical protein|uniref:hypothetical protein n=1 Tax=Achromobacter sp. 2789STDY5608633 TaxID=1806501 RepID=UPI0006BF2F78|nr:hypothetical protein [Achromobacter sp. 2789STDY5608633]CUJ69267.1 Uncharacterised protein [Achromobacter sp. 2789STDY5608633]
MDPTSSFLFDLFKNILSSRMDHVLFGRRAASQPVDEQAAPLVAEDPLEPKLPVSARRFRTFDATDSLVSILQLVEGPVVHLLVEDQPSTHYRLPGYVLESTVTGEWYVFARGRLALEGTGGGANNMRDVSDLLRERGVRIVGWVIPQADMDALEGGRMLWNEARAALVPLLSFISNDDEWEWRPIRDRFAAVVNAKRKTLGEPLGSPSR